MPYKLKIGDEVIFKQRESRHLSVYSDRAWGYESGSVVSINEDKQMYNVCWLDGHHSRNDDVPLKDIVTVLDKTQPVISVGPFRGPSLVLQEIVEEGED